MYPSTINFPPALAVEVAVNELARTAGNEIYSDEEIASQFDMTGEQLVVLNKNPLFRSQVLNHKSEVKEANGSIKRKAALALEYYLANWVPEVMASTSISPDTQLKVLQVLSKLSGAEQIKSDAVQVAEAMATAKSQPQIILNFPPGIENPMGRVIEHAAV